MASKKKGIADKPSVDSSTQPSDDQSDSSKPSDGPSGSKPSGGEISKPNEAPKAAGASKASQGQPDRNRSSPKPLNVLLDATVLSSRKVPISHSTDYYSPWITGCTFLPSGHAVLCDHSNNRIKLLDQSLSLQETLYTGYPGDVAVIDKSNVIITLPGNEQAQYVTVLPKLKLGGAFSIGKKGYGIDVAGDKIFVACHSNFSEDYDGEVRVFDFDGILQHRIGVFRGGSCMFSKSHNLAVSKSGTKLYVSDLDTRMITCLANDGSVIYEFKDANLKGPRNVYVDADDNALVCDYDNNCVHIITSKGRKHKALLTPQSGIMKPNSIAFRPSDGTLIIGCADEDKLYVFSLG